MTRQPTGRHYKLTGYLLLWLAGLLLLVQGQAVRASVTTASVPGGLQSPQWTLDLPSRLCPNSTTGDTDCHFSSPVIADVDGDGYDEIVVATNRGHVLAVNHDGTVLWNRDVAPAFGMAPGTQQIASSPAVADIDGDSLPEIVVGTGTTRADVCTQGGMIVLEHDGAVKPGWPVLAQDVYIEPNGCADTIFATPALADLDGDGDMEIIASSFDKRIYAWHHDGTPVQGFPPASYLMSFRPDLGLEAWLADTIWSSPSVGLVDGDGSLDIITGSDEGLFEGIDDWSCPYRPPGGAPADYCGGTLYGLGARGQFLENFPRHIHEVIDSTPALADVDGDGQVEIFVGTGTYYYRDSPDHPTLGFRVYGLDGQGNDLPGWEGGKAVGSGVPASPSIGDITGDGKPNIVVASGYLEKKLYAWHSNGQPVAGFPMLPVDHFKQTLADFNVGTGFVLADVDGDTANEILFVQGWNVTIVDGNGTQITAAEFPTTERPIYVTGGTLINTPAVGDIDRDGRLELIAQNSQLTVWELPASTPRAAWPMFKHDAARTGNATLVSLYVAPNPIHQMIAVDQGLVRIPVEISSKGQQVVFSWEATIVEGTTARPEPTSGVATGTTTIFVEVDSHNLELGRNDVAILVVSGTVAGEAMNGSPLSVPITVTGVEVLTSRFLPLILH